MTTSRARSRTSRSSASDAAQRAWQRAVRLLAVRDRSEQEMRARLATREVSPATVERTIRRLRDLRYLDDRRFALLAAERAVRRGHGSVRVRGDLAVKGVDQRLIDEVIGAAFGDEMALAREVLAQRYTEAPQQPAARAQAARFLLRRGFPEAVVLAIVGEGC